MATPGRRPGGLTALAVLNFVMAGWSFLNLMGSIAVVALGGAMKEAAQTPEDRQVFEVLESVNMGLWALIIATWGVALVLLIVSGVGYIKMRKWGRTIGNLYGISSLALVLLVALFTPSQLGGGFSISTIIGLIYPTLTLFFINVTFKEELSPE